MQIGDLDRGSSSVAKIGGREEIKRKERRSEAMSLGQMIGD